MSGFGFDAKEDRAVGCGVGLEACSELSCVEGIDTVVVIGGHDEGDGIGDRFFEFVIRRICPKPSEFFCILWIAVLRDPESGDGGDREADHIGEGDLAGDGPKEIGALGHGCGDEQTAVASAAYGESLGLGDAVGDQPFGGSDKVVEDILFFVASSCFVPRSAVFSAAAKVGKGKDTTAIEPREEGGHKGRLERDFEAAVAVEFGGVVSVALESFAIDEKHRDACAIFGGVEDLFGLIAAEVYGDADLFDAFEGLGGEIVAVSGGGVDPRSEAKEDLVALGACADIADAAFGGERDLAQELALARKQQQARDDIFHRVDQQVSFDKEDFLKDAFLLGDQGLPMFLCGVMERGDQDATTGGFVGGGDQHLSVHDVGAELPLESFGEGEEGAFGGDGSVIKVVVGPVDAGGDVKHAAVGRDGRIEPSFFFESFAKDQAVVCGGSTEAMVKDPSVVVFVPCGDGARGRIGDVKKAESVAIPNHRGPAGLVDAVGEMGFCGDIEDADL